jgi:small-conductance mechanosensitive channel
LEHWQALLWSAIIVTGAVLLALVAHRFVFTLAKRVSRRTGGIIKDSLIRHGERPTRWIFPLLALVLVLPTLPFRSDVLRALQHGVGLGLILSVGWVFILLADVFGDALYAKYRIDVSDNLAARRVLTQIHLLRRIFVAVVVIVTAAVMLMTFPAIHQLGTSLLASAGLAGLIVGMAMKPTLSSLIAGLQIALTEPIHIDDVVIVQGEFGWIEEIQTTYVIVRTWDLRRLVVPLSYFIENPFQNWTRKTADLLGTVFLYVDYSVPVEAVRQELRRILESSPLWDGKCVDCRSPIHLSTPWSYEL